MQNSAVDYENSIKERDEKLDALKNDFTKLKNDVLNSFGADGKGNPHSGGTGKSRILKNRN